MATGVSIDVYRRSDDEYLGKFITDDKTNFGISINAFDINSPDKSGSSYSNSFKIPSNGVNDQILGNMNINLINIGNQSAYTGFYVKVRYSEMDINLKFNIKVTSFDYEYYSINLVKDKSIFDRLKEISVDSLLKAGSVIPGVGGNYYELGDISYDTLFRRTGYGQNDDWVGVRIYGLYSDNQAQNEQNSINMNSTPAGVCIRYIFDLLETQHNIKISINGSNNLLEEHFIMLQSTYINKDTSSPYQMRIIGNINQVWDKGVGFDFLPSKITLYTLLKDLAKIGFFIIDDISTESQDEIYLGDLYTDLNQSIDLSKKNYKIVNKSFATKKQYINNYVKFGGIDEGQNELYGAYNILSNNENLVDSGDFMKIDNTFWPTLVTDPLVFGTPFYTHNYNILEPKDSVEDKTRIFYTDGEKTFQNYKMYRTNSPGAIAFTDSILEYKKPNFNLTYYTDIFGNTEVLKIKTYLSFFELFDTGGVLNQYDTYVILNGTKYFINSISNFQFDADKEVTMELIRMDSI